MMKICFFSLMMIPLSLSGLYWLVQVFFFCYLLFFFSFCYDFSFMYMGYTLCMDLLSYWFVLLSLWICCLMILSSFSIYDNNNYSYLFIVFVLLLFISLLIVFSSMNLFMFYLFFEFSLVPTLFLILGWGFQPERLEAGYYLMFYTLFSSLPMMISVFYLYLVSDSLVFVFLGESINSLFLFFCVNLVFFIKSPMYLLHLWLPKAHVEAPISGSMILAGVMLKLGGYGMIRLLWFFLWLSSFTVYFFLVVSLLGGVYVSLICLRQSDIKSLIAYSSVSHMSLVLGGLFTFSCWGFNGSFIMMIAHGLCSSGLFCLANISYERLFSRSLFLNKGLMNIMPSFSLWWFLFCSFNMAAPPSFNLLGEIMLINSIISWSCLGFIFLVFISFFGAVCSLYLYSYSQHGKYYSGVFSFSSGVSREYLLLFLHLFPLVLLFLLSEFFILC
uniref:NADH-ubiquinone oxidoreductase chain 4 n=1 Tax=Trinodes hirtus TaxID=442100 RepID=S4SUB1_9COLE|nr:NADH dehydrogenase subunit 4 [Trinodes hirtus]